ncbi:MAG: peptidoglycan recognition family protein [Pseudomonadota bacterium]
MLSKSAFSLLTIVIGLTSGAFHEAAIAADKPPLLSRDAWGAKKPIPRRMKRMIPREIIIHHTAIKQQRHLSLERKMRGLQSYSQRTKRWGDAPYHFYIGQSGRTAVARPIAYAGDTNTRYSVKNRIMIVLEGHFDKERPKPAQLKALRKLVAWLASKYKIAGTRLSGHNDHTPTSCPGRTLKAYLPELRMIADRMQ